MDSLNGSQVEAVVHNLLGEPNRAMSSKTELRYGSRGSMAVDLKTGTWFDHENNRGGGLIDLTCEKQGCGRLEAANWLDSHGIDIPRKKPARPRIVKAYDYRDETGALLFQVVRFEPKTFRQRQPDLGGGWKWSLNGCRRVLYRLPELLAADAKDPVYLVEGEKDADRLAACGLVATTNPGGANKWRDEYTSMLAGREVVVLADNDLAGQDHEKAVMAALAGHVERVARVSLPNLPPKGDVSDWLDSGGCLETLKDLAEAALAASSGSVRPAKPEQRQVDAPDPPSAATVTAPTAEPLPLIRSEEPAEPVPPEYLGPFEPAVAAIGTLTQAPPAIALQSVLGAASLASQALADVETLAGPRPISLALLTIAQSGERKSACDTLALSSMRDVERARLRDFHSARQTHDLAQEIYDAERKAILRTRDVLERDADLEALGAPPVPPLAPHLLFGDPTLEGLLRHFDGGQPSIGVFSDEGGQLIGGHAMNAENKLKTSAAYSKLWDGGEINRARASAPATRYYQRRMACHLMVQPLVAEKLLNDPTIRDQGLLSRMLVSWPESRIGFRSEASEEARMSAERALEKFHRSVAALLEEPLPTGADSRELEPRLLPLSSGARTLLRQFAEAVEVAQRPAGPCAGIRGVASKAAEQAARIAGVMTLFEDPAAVEVSERIMAAAMGLMDWYLREARRLLDTAPISGTTADAEALRCWLMDRWEDSDIDIRSAVRCGPRRLRETARIKALFKVLEEHGWLIPKPGLGRQKTWRLVRP